MRMILYLNVINHTILFIIPNTHLFLLSVSRVFCNKGLYAYTAGERLKAEVGGNVATPSEVGWVACQPPGLNMNRYTTRESYTKKFDNFLYLLMLQIVNGK